MLKRIISLIGLFVSSFGLIILSGFVQGTDARVMVGQDKGPIAAPPSTGSSWLLTQNVPSTLVQEAGRRIYEELPDFPLANDYRLKDSGDVATDNTLAGRLIRYHLYVRGRSPKFRLDWKLTLGDYLGVNELLEWINYPSSDILTTNPMEQDRELIQRLNRPQRDALIQVLVNVFNPEAVENQIGVPESTPTPTPTPTPNLPPQPSPLPQPGDANLLK